MKPVKSTVVSWPEPHPVIRAALREEAVCPDCGTEEVETRCPNCGYMAEPVEILEVKR